MEREREREREGERMRTRERERETERERKGNERRKSVVQRENIKKECYSKCNLIEIFQINSYDFVLTSVSIIP